MVGFITKGRFGNFHFIAAAAYAYSLKHGLEFHVPDKSLAPHLWPVYLQHLRNSNWNPNLETVYVNDEGHKYHELPFEESWRDKNIIIGTTSIETGYFQSYRYLQGYEEQIRREFNFSGETKNDVCSIHWRLTDYRSLPDKHPILTDRYMLEAIKYIKNKTGVNKFKFYSDEINHCEEFVDRYFKSARNFSF